MKDSKTIQCDVQDHFEITCMRKSAVSLTLKNGTALEGVAEDLRAHEGAEYLQLRQRNKIIEINLMDIKLLKYNNGHTPIQLTVS